MPLTYRTTWAEHHAMDIDKAASGDPLTLERA
jgi:hypothetical protein